MKSEIKPSLYKKLVKLSKKNKVLYTSTLKKINEIINSKNINHYKNLKNELKDSKRVHIGKSFVLIFSVKENLISFEDLDHHDNIYKKLKN